MKRFLSTRYQPWAFNAAMLLLRLGMGLLMIPHGYDKMVRFQEKRQTFLDFLGMGSSLSLALVIFAEFFCALFVMIGLFTRLTVLPLIVTMSVAVFVAKNADFFGSGETPSLFLIGFIAILLCGPGKSSVDGVMGK